MLLPRSSRRRGMTGPRGLLAIILSLLAACEDVVVMPADVAAVRIVPEEAQVSVGASVQLAAELEDLEGRPVRGQRIAWSSDDPEIATVDGDGRVVGDRSGTTTIRARAGSAEGTAVVRVLTPASIRVNQTSVSFSMESGGSPPAPQNVSVTNGGEAPLTGLATATSYGGGGSGWLAATLSGTSAPATLTIAVVAGSVPPPGEYQATVRVSASSAEDPVNIAVSLEVRAPPQRQRPPPPSNLRIDGVADESIRLSWDSQGDDVTEFRVERRSGDQDFARVATVGGGTTTLVDGSVEADTRYTYRVRACNDAGCSDPSNEASAATAPAAPTNLRTENVNRNRVLLAWTNNSRAAPVFEVERASLTGSFSLLATTAEDATTYDDRTVSGNQTYRYRVRACNESGCSSYSNTLIVFVPN
jgi:hypothetical protein